MHVKLTYTSIEKPFVSVDITWLVLMFRKASNNHFYRTKHYKVVFSRQEDIVSTELMFDTVEELSVKLQKLLREQEVQCC